MLGANPSYTEKVYPLQQVTDLKKEKEALEKKLAHYIKEKAALEGEVEKLREENADLIADVETLKEWSEDLHKLVKIINRDFENCLMTST